MKARLYLDVEFDESKTDAESVATALDRVLETGMSTPGVLDEYGDPTAGEFFVLDTETARQRRRRRNGWRKRSSPRACSRKTWTRLVRAPMYPGWPSKIGRSGKLCW